MFSKLAKELHRFTVRRRSLAAVRVKNPDFGDLKAFCAEYAARTRTAAPTQSLDLGCGATPRNPFNADVLSGIDIREDPARNVKHADLAIEPIPYADDSFDYITAFDFLEHIPRVLYVPTHRFPFVMLMNEIHRTLKPGGVLLSHTPAYPLRRRVPGSHARQHHCRRHFSPLFRRSEGVGAPVWIHRCLRDRPPGLEHTASHFGAQKSGPLALTRRRRRSAA